MPEQTPESASLELPENPNLEWLRKQAKTRLAELRQVNPSAKLAEAQFELAKRYGFSSWRALKEHLDSLTLEGQIIEVLAKATSRYSASVARLLNELAGQALSQGREVLRADQRIDVLDVRGVLEAANRVDGDEAVSQRASARARPSSSQRAAAHAATGPKPS